ncbi:hypothetical protein K6119_05265 [Paracrocinitomix mangrovi]|uniref:hypothetical protein n=1 Tax=Paracrocinitomix mangrovi TaxID=2862509 RepID=UPI001EDAB616|nr:hypothetical protein [Paracrocinitomix mangrovi]UKN02923.1 hypothetical protein K6119_05265 [Paracrocinitomix mangrovi]
MSGISKMEKFLKKIDKIMFGIMAGILFAVIGFVFYYFVKTRGLEVSFSDYMSLAFTSNEQQQDVLMTCLIPNMFLFYFTNFRWQIYEFTKGLVGITVAMLMILIFLTF